MIVETLRELVSWCEDPVEGYDAIRGTMPVEAGDSTPPACRIVDASRIAWAARGTIPVKEVKAGPMLIVQFAGEAEVAMVGEDGLEFSNSVPIAVVYAAAGDDNSQEQFAGYQALRTVHRIIARRFNAGSDPLYVRAFVTINRPTRATYTPPLADETDTIVSMALLLTFPTDDPWALGAPVT